MPWGIAAAGIAGGALSAAGQSDAAAASAAVAQQQLDWTKKVYENAQKDIVP